MKIYAKDNKDIIHVFFSDASYNKYKKRGLTRIDKSVALDLKAYSIPKTRHIERIENLISNIIDNECKKEKYFHKIGFLNGMKSVDRFSHNPDAQILYAWKRDVYRLAENWFKKILLDQIDISVLTNSYIIENLPKVDANNLNKGVKS